MPRKRLLQLIIARHAESGFNNQNRIQGHMDSQLTDTGKRQAVRLAVRLSKMNIKKIYSSDIGRALSTTRTIAKRLGASIIPEPSLREINLGLWEGLTPAEVNKRFQKGYEQWRKSPSRMVIPGGEGIRRFRQRVLKGVERIVNAEKRGPILLVTHGGVIAVLLSHWMKADFDRILLNLKVDNTSLTFVEFNARHVVLHAINDTTHLSQKENARGFTVFTQRD